MSSKTTVVFMCVVTTIVGFRGSGGGSKLNCRGTVSSLLVGPLDGFLATGYCLMSAKKSLNNLIGMSFEVRGQCYLVNGVGQIACRLPDSAAQGAGRLLRAGGRQRTPIREELLEVAARPRAAARPLRWSSGWPLERGSQHCL